MLCPGESGLFQLIVRGNSLVHKMNLMGHAMRKRVFGHMRTAQAKLRLEPLQNHLTLQNVSIEDECTDEISCMRGKNLNMCVFLRMLEDTFTLDVVHLMNIYNQT